MFDKKFLKSLKLDLACWKTTKFVVPLCRIFGDKPR